MSPTVSAVFTVFTIGIVSFLIGWWLTKTKWKGNFFKAEQRRKNAERRNRKLEASLKKAEQSEQEYRKRIQSLSADAKRLEREAKKLKKEKTYKASGQKPTKASAAINTNSILNELNEVKKKNIELTRQVEKLKQITPNNIIKQKKPIHKFGSRGPVQQNTDLLTAVAIQHPEDEALDNKAIYPKLDSILDKISIFSNAKHRDDLIQVEGIDKVIAHQLNQGGFYNFKQLAMLRRDDLKVICDFLQLPIEKPIKEKWVAQANHLYYKKYG